MIMTEYDAMRLHINSEKKESYQEGREEMILAMVTNGVNRNHPHTRRTGYVLEPIKR